MANVRVFTTANFYIDTMQDNEQTIVVTFIRKFAELSPDGAYTVLFFSWSTLIPTSSEFRHHNLMLRPRYLDFVWKYNWICNNEFVLNFALKTNPNVHGISIC